MGIGEQSGRTAGRLRLFVAAIGLALAGFALGALVFGGMEAGGSGDSNTDVALVVGSLGALIGLFIAWAGARFVWPSTSGRGLAQNPQPPSKR